MPLDKKARAEALAAMTASDGWKIVEDHLKEAIELCKDNALNSKKTKTYNDLLFYRAKYDSYSKLLFLVDRWIKDGADG